MQNFHCLYHRLKFAHCEKEVPLASGCCMFYDIIAKQKRLHVSNAIHLNLHAKCRWQNTSLQMTTSLDSSTVDFLLGFARLCYHLVKSGNIKMTALLNDGDTDAAVNNTLSFPDLGGVCIDQVRSWGGF